MTELDAEVGIVGYGPVGTTLAILLGQLGHSVIVLERWPEPYPLPRAVHYDGEVGRIFQSCGIGDSIRAVSEPADVYEWRNAEGTTLLRLGREGIGPTGWPRSSMFNQPAAEAILDERARSLSGVTVRRDSTVVSLDEKAGSVLLETADGQQVEVAYAVGCDGANSTVRELMGTPVTDLGFFYDWLIVDLILAEERVFDPINMQICDPARPTTVVSGGPGRRRFEFMRLPDEELFSLNEEERAWELLASWDIHPGNAKLERHAVYTFNARYAERWREGRVLLAGDSAHLMPPFAGQGMCSGVRDAANLAWKLDLVLRGLAADDLLDTYEEERLPSARAAIELSIELGKIICIPDPAEAAQRDEAMAGAVGAGSQDVPDLPAMTSGLIDPGSAHAGSLFVQGSAGGELFDEVHGASWRLVASTGSAPSLELDAATSAWFESIGGAVVEAEPDDEVLGRWFADKGVEWALQRPDFFLYGTAESALGAAGLLQSLRRGLGGRASAL